MDRGSCDPPGGIRAAGAHRWLRGRPLTWNALVWGALLLLDPALDVSRHRPLLPAVLLLVAVAATCVGTGFAAARRTAPYVTDLCLFALASLTITTTLAYGRHWGTLWLLLSIMAGAALRRGRAPYAVVAVTIGAGLAAWAIDGSWTRIWTQALVVFLSGAGTYVFRWLLEVIAELDRTREELARRAVEDERQRFSRDLHDLLGHTLSVIVVKSEAVRRLVHRDPELAASYAGDIETVGRRALVEVREAVDGYRRTTLAAETDRAGNALAAAGIAVEIRTHPEPLPAETEAAFAWVVREGVTNVIRHSGARNCRIEVRDTGDATVLELRDDGRGAPGGITAGGGIDGLRQRLAAANGRLETRTLSPGFALTARMPAADRTPGPDPVTATDRAAQR